MKNIVKGKQCNILCHFYDLRMLHVDSEIFSSVLADIDTEYRNISKMTITRGKIHKDPRMTIDYSFPGKEIFSMVDYIGNILNDIP